MTGRPRSTRVPGLRHGRVLFTESINILAMVILGGMGNLRGVMLTVLMVVRPQGLLAVEGRREVEEPEPAAAESEAQPGRGGELDRAVGFGLSRGKLEPRGLEPEEA